MKRKRIFTILVLVLLTCALSTTAFAIDESEVESAIAASSQEEVAGNMSLLRLQISTGPPSIMSMHGSREPAASSGMNLP